MSDAASLPPGSHPTVETKPTKPAVGSSGKDIGSNRFPWLAFLVLAVSLMALVFYWFFWQDTPGIGYQALAVGLGTIFFQGALRRYYKYKLEIQQLIEGRMEKLEEDKQASKDPETAVKQVESMIKIATSLSKEFGALKESSSEMEKKMTEGLAQVNRQLEQRDVLGGSNLVRINEHLAVIERLVGERRRRNPAEPLDS